MTSLLLIMTLVLGIWLTGLFIAPVDIIANLRLPLWLLGGGGLLLLAWFMDD